MGKPYHVFAIANEFIKLAGKNKQSITHLKLQKLVYFAQGWHLALTGGQQLFNEPILAWRFGPVIELLYQEFRGFGDRPITKPATKVELGDGGIFDFTTTIPKIDLHDNYSLDLTKKIWEVYGGYDAMYLSEITHYAGSPWSKAYSIAANQEIDNRDMLNYFTSLKDTKQ